MAVASVDTSGLLNWWAIRMQENLYHFNQLDGDLARAMGYAAYVYVQPERDQIAEAIQQAVTMVGQKLRLLPRPTYLTDRIPVRRFRRGAPLYTRFGYVKQLGKRAIASIQPGAEVNYTGNIATMVVPVPTTVTDPDEVQVFIQRSDGAVAAASELWRIEPLQVSIDDGFATITGHRSLFAKPSLWAEPYLAPGYNASDKNTGDADSLNSYVEAVDVYRVYPDTTSAVRLLQQQGNADASSETIEIEWSDLDLGEFQPAADYDLHQQGIVEISYLAGYPLLNHELDPNVRTALLRLANCELNTTISAFQPERLNTLQYDTMVETVNKEPLNDKNAPFGQKRGQVQAWQALRGIGMRVLVVDV